MSQPYGWRLISSRREAIRGDDSGIGSFSLTTCLRHAELSAGSIDCLDYSRSVIKRDAICSHSPHTHGGVCSTRLQFQYYASSLEQFCFCQLACQSSSRGCSLHERVRAPFAASCSAAPRFHLPPQLGNPFLPPSTLPHEIQKKTGENRPRRRGSLGLTTDLKLGSFIHRD